MSGRAFQAKGLTQQNVHPLYIDNLTRGTSSWPRSADCRRRWPSMLVRGLQGLQISARYPAAMLWLD